MPNDEYFESARNKTNSPVTELSPARRKQRDRDAVWNPLTNEERLQWSDALLSFNPSRLNSIAGQATIPARTGEDVIWFKYWVAIAHEWDALGFTARDWYDLQASLHLLAGDYAAAISEISHVSDLGLTLKYHLAFQIAPNEWLDWLQLRRAGVSPLRTTQCILRKKLGLPTVNEYSVPSPN